MGWAWRQADVVMGENGGGRGGVGVYDCVAAVLNRLPLSRELGPDSVVRCRYIAAQYNMLLHTSLQRLSQNINQSLNPQKKLHTLAAMWLSFVRILEKTDRVIMAPHCIKMSSYQYKKSCCGDKMVIRSSYLRNGISYTGETTSLY